jgi:BirA family biotin operon repressor/biotin-[acetyl-CoA-carboxylase] ligase
MKFTIQFFNELPSTNTFAREQAAQGAAQGLVIVADYQTVGRGKPGRKWVSPAGKDLLFSLLLRPPVRPNQAPMITQIACRSVAEVLNKRYKIPTTFKRPNDILVKGKKICGVLTEAQSLSNRKLESVVVGIGLNVNSEPQELPETATSLKAFKGQEYPREKILKEILDQLLSDLKEFYDHSA